MSDDRTRLIIGFFAAAVFVGIIIGVALALNNADEEFEQIEPDEFVLDSEDRFENFVNGIDELDFVRLRAAFDALEGEDEAPPPPPEPTSRRLQENDLKISVCVRGGDGGVLGFEAVFTNDAVAPDVEGCGDVSDGEKACPCGLNTVIISTDVENGNCPLLFSEVEEGVEAGACDFLAREVFQLAEVEGEELAEFEGTEVNDFIVDDVAIADNLIEFEVFAEAFDADEKTSIANLLGAEVLQVAGMSSCVSNGNDGFEALHVLFEGDDFTPAPFSLDGQEIACDVDACQCGEGVIVGGRDQCEILDGVEPLCLDVTEVIDLIDHEPLGLLAVDEVGATSILQIITDDPNVENLDLTSGITVCFDTGAGTFTKFRFEVVNGAFQAVEVEVQELVECICGSGRIGTDLIVDEENAENTVNYGELVDGNNLPADLDQPFRREILCEVRDLEALVFASGNELPQEVIDLIS